jgi:CRP-like cAMP-binding protein
MDTRVTSPRNRILGCLPPEDLNLLRPHLRPVALEQRRRVAVPGARIDCVYFLESGLVSMMTRVRTGPPIEVGVIGREGVVNFEALMAIDHAANESVVQLSGDAHCIDVRPLREAASGSAALDRACRRFIHVFLVQTATTVLANGRANISERLARWLLMTHDRIDGDAISLTHEFLSIMLGVRRSSVTTAIRDFERRGLVALGRRCITVADPNGLRRVAGGYYGMAEAELERLFPAGDS